MSQYFQNNNDDKYFYQNINQVNNQYLKNIGHQNLNLNQYHSTQEFYDQPKNNLYQSNIPSLGSSLHPSLGSSLYPSLGSSLHPSLGSSLHPSLGSSLHPSLGSSLGPPPGFEFRHQELQKQNLNLYDKTFNDKCIEGLKGLGSEINIQSKNLPFGNSPHSIDSIIDFDISLDTTNLNKSTKSIKNNEPHYTKENIIFKIKDWSSSNYNTYKMIEIYNKNKKTWEEEDVLEYSIKSIVCYLTKYCRYDVLNYLRINNKIYTNDKYFEGDFFPFHELVWLGKSQILKQKKSYNLLYPKNMDNIIKTFNELLSYGFGNILFDCKIYQNKKENFINAIFPKNNQLKFEQKKELQEYFVNTWSDVNICLLSFDNLINQVFKNKISDNQEFIFIINKFSSVMVKKILFWLFDNINIDKVLEDDKKIINLVQILTYKIDKQNHLFNCQDNIDDYCMSNINLILENYKNWIFDYIYAKHNITINNDIIEKDTTNCYNIIYSIFGKLYNYNLRKTKIIQEINNNLSVFFDINHDNITIVVLNFISNSKINLEKMDLSEKKLITDFITLYFRQGNMARKIYIKDTIINIAKNKEIFEDLLL